MSAEQPRYEHRPLGLRRTLRFFFIERYGRVARWRHFGWELEIEICQGTPSFYLTRED